MRYTN